MPKEFPTEAVISAATGMLICPFDKVHEVCTYMAGEPVWTHQLPRVGREVEATLKQRHPELAQTFAEAEGITPDNWQEFRDRFIARHGATLTVAPMSEDQHQGIDPVSELAEMVPPDRIIQIVQ